MFAGAPVCFRLLLLPLPLLLLQKLLLLLLLLLVLLLLLGRACAAGRPWGASSAGICVSIGSGRPPAAGRRRGLRAWGPTFSCARRASSLRAAIRHVPSRLRPRQGRPDLASWRLRPMPQMRLFSAASTRTRSPVDSSTSPSAAFCPILRTLP